MIKCENKKKYNLSVVSIAQLYLLPLVVDMDAHVGTYLTYLCNLRCGILLLLIAIPLIRSLFLIQQTLLYVVAIRYVFVELVFISTRCKINNVTFLQFSHTKLNSCLNLSTNYCPCKQKSSCLFAFQCILYLSAYLQLIAGLHCSIFIYILLEYWYV